MALKNSLRFFLVVALFGSILYSADEKKGQRYYLKNCKKCHGFGKRGGNLATIDGWSEYFKDGAKELKAMHDDQPEVLKYLNSDKFLNKEKFNMEKFLKDFAKDSTKIQTCES